jgi:hypothetical protein
LSNLEKKLVKETMPNEYYKDPIKNLNLKNLMKGKKGKKK